MRTLGPYVLLRRLGAGGMGEVWVGRREGLGGASRNLAIKTLLAARAEEESARKMFIEEGRLSMRLSNSNIVQVFEVERASDGTCYMAMELIDGMDLSKLLKKLAESGEKLPFTLVGFILGEILKALAYSHELDYEGKRMCIVHRDISPHNVMVSIHGEVKLMDFGIARVASEQTSGLFVKGKLRYMPPEQVRGETREPTVDLFAVGAVLYEMIEGKTFRSGEYEEGQMLAMVLDCVVPPLEREVPSELAAIYRDLVLAKPSERLGSARAAYRRLAQWSGYRDAKFDLEDLVRRYSTPVAERSQLDQLALDELPTQPRDSGQAATAVLPEGSATDVERVTTSEKTGSGSAATTRTNELPASRSGSAPVREPAKPSNANTVLALGLAAIGLGFGVFATGTMAGWWGTSEPVASAEPVQQALVQPQALEQPAPVQQQAPVQQPGPEQPAPVPQTTGGVGTTSTTGEEGQTGEEGPTDDGGGDSPPTATTKVRVTIMTTHPYAEIDLAGKVYVIDPTNKITSQTTRIKPGEYSVSYRDSIEGSWQDAGKITVPKARAVTLELVGKAVTVK